MSEIVYICGGLFLFFGLIALVFYLISVYTDSDNKNVYIILAIGFGASAAVFLLVGLVCIVYIVHQKRDPEKNLRNYLTINTKSMNSTDIQELQNQWDQDLDKFLTNKTKNRTIKSSRGK